MALTEYFITDLVTVMSDRVAKNLSCDSGVSSLRQISNDAFFVINEVVVKRLGHVPILKGDFHLLPHKVQLFVAEKTELMRPRGIFICDGSQHEAEELMHKLVERGMLSPLRAYENNYICRTDPRDVARVENKTWMVTPDKYQTMCHVSEGIEPIMGHWMSPETFGKELDSRFPGCMAGRIMYVIPFSMGPVGGPLSKIGVQLTDSNYVVLCMRIMTRVSPAVWDALGDNDFVRCIHSVGLPRPVKQRVINHWPCNPERVIVAHRPLEREIWSFGSGYGGNSLLGKKCFALRIASNIALDEGWMAEHMLIMGVTRPNGKEHFIAAAFPSACGKTNLAMHRVTRPNGKEHFIAAAFPSACGVTRPNGKEHFIAAAFPSACGVTRPNGKEHFIAAAFPSACGKTNLAMHRVTRPNGKEHFIAAAFPSACGKTNLAMLEPTLPGWKVRCVGDDIAWMKFGEDGRLYGINPESGFFGVCPGTSKKTNPVAVATFQKNSIFTNVAETADGEYFWEGLEDELKDKNVEIINWLGERWHIGDPMPAAHPNSRFTAPASQCPIIHPDWESPKGVPIEAIIFGGRRPEGVPLVFETFSWCHGILTGACLKSEATAAAEYKARTVMHDPMAMRPFIGYNFGRYLQHWIDLDQPGRKLPKIYHVNWFRKNKEGKFLWPGYGENIRVIDWIVRRLDGEATTGKKTAIGVVPAEGSLNLQGLDQVEIDELMSVPLDYWRDDVKEMHQFLEEQVGSDLPAEIRAEMLAQEKRIGLL
ncbi:Phosphoenolpyruvate carboxykinase [GTP] [Toxocara canis]|uniref:Phosphoenolpyruvate carboxykinase [GTP] n=1 Tax=Toxocara canis TaxID=6265 RepID=A0A0B2W105_TOXCA|nr:Phosphoenolpyruvate carboxykinase [GTP] [Toxocara canis]